MEIITSKLMEEFLEQGNETLTIIKEQAAAAKKHSEAATEQATAARKATKFNMWLFSIILVIILGFEVDTRLEVVKKVDASELRENYMTKVASIGVHKLEKAATIDLVLKACQGDTTICPVDYEYLISSVFDINYRGE
jgi:anaerobic C4-dicarboxylate transporter